MLSVELYKQNKLAFLELANDTSSDKRKVFLHSITATDIGNYQDLILFLENLESIDFLINTAFTSRVKFIDQAIKILAETHKHNQKEYDEFTQKIIAPERVIFNEGKILEPDLFVLRSFLFSFKRAFTEIELKYMNEFFKSYGSHFIKPYKWKQDYEIYYGQYAPYLIEQNSRFAEYILSIKYAWEFKSAEDRQAVIEAFTTSSITPKETKFSYLNYELGRAAKIIGKPQDIPNGKFIITSKYTLLKHNNPVGKSLLIYGHDNDKAFENSHLALNLFLENHDVLILDARDKSISLNDIAKSIQDTGFQDLDEVYIMMHGKPTPFTTDLALYLSVGLLSTVKASTLFDLIVQETINQPIKAVIYSCHSQLITHKIANILPKGSEVITLSEHQVIDNKEHVLSAFTSFRIAFDDYLDQGDLKETAVKTTYYFNQDCDSRKTPSYTYTKIGECNFRTPVNLIKQDIIDLLAKVPKSEVVYKVSNYLGNSTNEEEIREYTHKLFSMVESTTDTHPLLNYREQTEANSDFHKYLGVAGAIYAIYDQCGEGYIADSDFTPIEDSIMESILEYYAGNQAAINTVMVVSTLLNYMLLNN